jgi:uroporphyrinogen-III decarboxylase
MPMSSRDRMLNALSCRSVDHPPCCFIQFTALEDRCRDQVEMVEQLTAWGLDATVQVPPWLLTVPGDATDARGLPVDFDPAVRIEERLEPPATGERYPVLHKDYVTPAGVLSVSVNKTDDWPYGDHVPFLDDFIVPRARKMPVTGPADLAALRYLLTPPVRKDIAAFRAEAGPLKSFAARRGLLVSGGMGLGADMAGWLVGLQNLMLLAVDQPDFVAEVMRMIADWNRARMEVVLDEGVDLWVRRGWYEGCDFWSPKMYRQFIWPHLKAEVELAHRAGARFGYILTDNAMPLIDLLLEAGIDALIGVDPVMGGAELGVLREKAAGRMCLWGGVNAALTVQQGDPDQVREAVEQALTTLAPGHGFILAPVDEVDDSSERTSNNVQVFVQAWKDWRQETP